MELDNIELRRILETAIVAARFAGQKAMEEMSKLKVSIKNGNELVTQADEICQKIIIDRIKETYPDHGFIAEEGIDGKIFKQSPRGDSNIWWTIDPIDGTNNFAHKVPFFAVSIAALFDGVPVVGVIFDPATESMFTAVKDEDAQLNSRRIQVSNEELIEFASIGLDSHFEIEKDLPQWAVEIIKKYRYRNFGTTAIQLGYVAAGGLIATIVNTPKLWDIAAGALIVESAGGIITNWQGNKLFPVDPEKYEHQQLPCIAANKKVHPEMIKLLA